MVATNKKEVINKIINKREYIFNDELPDKISNAKNPHGVITRLLSKGNTLVPPDIVWEQEDIYQCFQVFVDIFGKIGEFVAIIPSIEMFCIYMNWNTKYYTELLNNPVYEIVMTIINDYLLDAQLSAGQLGLVGQNITRYRTQIKGDHGFNQSIVKTKEVVINTAVNNIDEIDKISTAEMENNIKLLLNNNKK